MDALTAEPLIQATPQTRRLAPIRLLEMVVVALAIATPVATFLFVRNFAHQVFNPGVAASLLLANLLPYVALISPSTAPPSRRWPAAGGCMCGSSRCSP